MKQIIAFRREKVYVSLNKEQETLPEIEFYTVQNELEEYGYRISLNALPYITLADLEEIHKTVLPRLHELFGKGKVFKPLFPGFPHDVLKSSEYERVMAQERHYETGKEPDGDIQITNREMPTYKTLEPIFHEDFMKIPVSIMHINSGLQKETKEELIWFLENYTDINFPERIPFKETMCLVMSYNKNYRPKDINDVLRFAFYKMGVSPDLPKVSKKNNITKKKSNSEWRNLNTLKRSERREILSLIEEVISNKTLDVIVPDVRRFYGHWVLLSERVHSGDYASQYPIARRFFETFQDKYFKKQYKTWWAGIQALYNSGSDIVTIAKAIAQRPGELVRRFDSLTRRAMKTGNESDIMDLFLETPGMKNKTLLELLRYYDRRVSNSGRIIRKPDGTLFTLPELPEINKEFIEVYQNVIIRKIYKNISDSITIKDMQGKKVWLEDVLKLVPIPHDMKYAQSTVPNGTKFEIPKDKRYVRFYVQWIQESEDNLEDLDLECFLINSEKNRAAVVAWNTNLIDEANVCVHSGDIRNRVGDCAEYVDIDLNQNVYKYALITIHNYTGEGLNTLPSWVGYEYREELKPGDAYYIPSITEQRYKLISPSANTISWLIDFESRLVTVIDIPTDSIPVSNYKDNLTIIEYMTVESKLNTFDVLKKHYESRGATLVKYEEEADEKIYCNDLRNDYTKILDIIGE